MKRLRKILAEEGLKRAAPSEFQWKWVKQPGRTLGPQIVTDKGIYELVDAEQWDDERGHGRDHYLNRNARSIVVFYLPGSFPEEVADARNEREGLRAAQSHYAKLRTAGKTHRRQPPKMFRHPGGQKNRDDPRPGARVPSAYDDLPHSGGTYTAMTAAKRMKAKGDSDDKILRSLRNKFKLDVKSAWGIIRWL